MATFMEFSYASLCNSKIISDQKCYSYPVISHSTMTLTASHINANVGFPAAEVVLGEVLELRLLDLGEAGQVHGTLVGQLAVVLVEADIQVNRLL